MTKTGTRSTFLTCVPLRVKRPLMEKSIVTGKSILDVGFWILDLKPGRRNNRSVPEIQNRKSKIQNGFSLLELMIAMFIMIILLSVAVPVYQRTVQHARETVLKDNLWQIRAQIDR